MWAGQAGRGAEPSCVLSSDRDENWDEITTEYYWRKLDSAWNSQDEKMTCKHDRRDFCSKARVDLGFGQGGLKILYLFQRILSKMKSIHEIYFQVSWPPLSEFSGIIRPWKGSRRVKGIFSTDSLYFVSVLKIHGPSWYKRNWEIKKLSVMWRRLTTH